MRSEQKTRSLLAHTSYHRINFWMMKMLRSLWNYSATRFAPRYITGCRNVNLLYIDTSMRIYLGRTWRRSRPVSRSWLISCREASAVSWWKSPPPRRTCCRCPAFPAAGPRPSGCQPGSSRRGCSRPPADQAQRPAVLVRNSRGRRRNRIGSRRPRDLCRVHDYRGPRRCHCLRQFTTYVRIQRFHRQPVIIFT